jgi:type I restriction enzyme, R subunit
LKPEERPKIDPQFEEVTEDAEVSTKENLRRKWAQLEAMVGTEKRLKLLAEDLVQHWEARLGAMDGKAMVVGMKGHGLMQAIARVNRVFKDKPGGLVVDYLGLAEELKLALVDYTNSKGKGEIKLDQEEAVSVMLEKYEKVTAILHGFDYQSAAETAPAKRMALIALAAEHVLQQNDGKPRYLLAVSELSKAFALSVPHEKALEIRDEVGFFQEVRAVLAKPVDGGDGKKSSEELDAAVRQIVSRAIASDKVIDIFDAAGLKKPDISILSDEFLQEVQHLPQRNLAVELLQKLLNNELKIRSAKYLVQSRSFAEMLEATIRKYQNRTIEAAQVIAELIELAKQMREGHKRGEKLGLTDDEVAFYDALEVNDSAVKVLGEPTLKDIARELVAHVRKSVTIDWTLREAAQAQIRVIVRRILRKYGYPPDKQEKATQTVLEQAKLLCAEWAG